MPYTPEQLKSVKLIVTDIDGVLTDGKIRLTDDGKEIKTFCAKDSPPLRIALANGLKVVFTTGRKSPAVEMRAAQYGLPVFYKSDYKDRSLMSALEEAFQINRTEILYIGDDLNDLAGMRQAGFTACPADAVEEVQTIAGIKTAAKGGEGVLGEIIRIVMISQNTWKDALSKFEQEQFAKPN